MEEIFLKLFNMSISAIWLVIAILLLRNLLKKAPKAIHVCLWALVGLRLLIPFSFESALSVIPSAETVPTDILYQSAPKIQSGIPILDSAVNPMISESLAPQLGDSVNPMQIITFIASVIWLIGIASMIIYAVVAYLRLKMTVRVSICAQDNVWICDTISSPFILGLIRPRIYLPSNISEQSAEYVISHERAHLRRLDHLWKPLGFLILSVYWFNPLLWLAYALLCRDIELACDQKVISTMETEDKKGYSEALLSCGARQRMITACPLAFGETGVKDRIKSVLSYKKPTLWIIIASILLVIATVALFLTDPLVEKSYSEKLLKIRTTHLSGFEASEPYNKYYPIKAGSGAVLPCDTVGVCDVSFTISKIRPDSLVILLSDELEMHNAEGGYEAVTEFLLMKGDSVCLSTPTDGGGESYVISIVDAIDGVTEVNTTLSPPINFSYIGIDGNIYYLKITDFYEMEEITARLLDVRVENGDLIFDVARINNSGKVFQLGYTYALNKMVIDYTNNVALVGKPETLFSDGKEVITSYNVNEEFNTAHTTGEYWLSGIGFVIRFTVSEKPFETTYIECDSASFDIDGDGKDEICSVGLTNYGLFSFTFAVREVGQAENRHFSVFYTDPMRDLSFVKNAGSGKVQLQAVSDSDGSTMLFDLAIKNGRITITRNGIEIGRLD